MGRGTTLIGVEEMRAADVLTHACQTYRQQVETLRTHPWQDKGVLILLRQRDRIQHLIDQLSKQPDTPALSPQLWADLADDDDQVEKWNDHLLVLEALPKWRTSLNPPDSHWWWWPKAKEQKPFLGWLWNGLTIALLTVTLALAKDIATRFFTGAPGIWSSIGAIAPVVLTLLATGGVLTKVGQQIIEAYLTRRGASERYWPLTKCALALGVLGLFFWGHSAGLPWAAVKYHQNGTQQYQAGRLATAQASFERALALNPNFPAANHALGLTYEDLREFKQARVEYAKAVKAGYLESVNNLARLYILEDEAYDSAVVVVLTALQDNERDADDQELEYSLRKNLGWAWFEQERFVAAQGELIRAIRIEAQLEGSRPDAHCLLAQVLDAQEEDADKVKAEWETCLRKISRPEDDRWAGMATKALSTQEQSNNVP